MKRMLLTLLAALGLIVPSLRAQEEPATPENWADVAITEWYGTGTASTYTITTAEQLAGLAKLVNEEDNTFEGKTITLSANVDLAGKAWTPIGDKESKKYFKGTFIGQPAEGETQVFLSNLKIDALADADREYQALFGAIEGATIKNLKVAGSVKAKNAAGIVARMNGGTNGSLIENCTNAVLVDGGTSKAGGIVCLTYGTCTIERCKNESAIGGAATGGLGGIVAYGNGNTTTIRECENVGDVGDEKARYAGGIVGYATGAGSIVEGCVNKGAIQAGTNVGGIAGISTGSWTIQGSTNEGEVTGVGGCTAGGIVGSNAAGRVEACANRGNVTGKYAGGVAGKMGEAGQMVDCSGGGESVSITATGAAGRLIGVVENGPNESQAAFLTIDDANGDDYTSLPTVGLMAPNSAWGSLKILAGTFHGEPSMGGNYGDLYFLPGTAWERNGSVDTSVAGKWRLTSNTDGWKQIEKTAIAKVGETDCSSWAEMVSAKKANPEATVTLLLDTFSIATLDDLKAFRDLVNAGVTFRGKTITLMANIDLKNEEWTPIGKNSTAVFRGTFDGTGKTISNLKISGTNDYVGLFGATNYNVDCSPSAGLKNLTLNNVSVSGGSYVGALAGNYYDKYVTNCHVTGTIAISGKKYVGGLIGKADATLTDCSVKGTAEAVATIVADSEDAANVGGLVGILGEHNYTVTNCATEYVSLSGNRKVGGLIGTAYVDDSIVGCSASHISITATTPDATYVEKEKSSLGFGGLVGIYTQHKSSAGSLIACAVEDVTFTVREEAVADALSMGAVTGGFEGSSAGPVDVSDKLATTVGITISGTNTGATNDYLEDVPACVYPAEKFDSASAFIKDFPEGKTVYDGETYHATMVEALQAIHLTGKTTLWCKPGADVETMTHGHVCQSLTVYGNGATVTGGEHDFELDTFKLNNCAGIQGELSLAIHTLNGAAVWGQRTTAHTLNVTLEDCEDINRVYISGTKGTNNITLTNCTASEKSSSCTVYSNAPGAITVENCTFTSVAQPICLNNNSGATQNVTVKGCTFTDCGTEATLPNPTSSVEVWASPIRVLTTKEGSVTNLRVDTCAFAYAEGATKCNGDILLGNGAENGKSFPTVTATIVNTTAEVQVQQPGDRPTGEVSAKPTKVVKVEASATETVIKNTLPIAEVDGVAYDTLPEVMTAIENKVAAGATAVTVKLLSDVSVENTMLSIPNGLALTLDLNGKTYTYTDDRTDVQGDGAARYAVDLGATSTLTVTDSSTDQTGTMKAVGTALCCLNNNGGTLNVLGGNFVVESSKSSYVIITRGGACTLEPEDGKTIVCTGGLKAATGTVRIAGETTINGQGACYAIYVGEQSGSPSASIEIAGGTFTAGSNGLAICVDTNWGVQAKATFDISGGTFTGKFGGDGTGTYTLSGGSYSVDPTTTASPSTVTLKPNYLPVQNAKDYYVVGPFVVAITEGNAKGGYRTLQEAVKAISALDPTPTITLLRDVVLEGEVALTKNISIDLAGHTLYAKDGNTLAFTADASVTVSFTGNGGSFVSKAQAAADNGSNVTIEGITTKAITKWTDEGAYDISWYVDGKTEYTLTTAAQVAGIAKMIERIEAAALENEEEADRFSTVTFTLGADIDLSALEWVSKAFDGVLDGNGHTIKGVRVSGTSTRGFFSTLGGTVKGIRFTDASISVAPSSASSKQRYGGVVAAKLSGTIANCVVEDSTITATGMTTNEGLGALAGTGSGTIEDCVVSGVTFEGSTTTGSFVGAGSATIANCYVDGALAQTSGTLTNVYAKNAEGRFVRHNTVDGTPTSETLGAGAALNGIGWLLNGQKTEDTAAWRVDSNEDCKTLLPFKADGVEVIPDVERRLTKSESVVPFPARGGSWYVYFANGYAATVKLNAEGKTVLTTTRDDYLVDEELELRSGTFDNINQVAVFGGCNGGTLNGSTKLTIEATKGTLRRVFGGSYSADATTSSITETANLTITGGTVEKAYGGSCGDASTVESGAKLTLNGGTVTTAVATSNGGTITGTATLEVASGTTTAAKLVAMERGTANNVTFSMGGVATGGICLSAESADAEASVTGTVKLDNKVANPGTVYLGAALEKVTKVDLRTSSSYPITVLAQTAAMAKAETVTIPAGQTVTIGTNVTLQVPADVTLEVAGTVSGSGKLVGTSATSLLKNEGTVGTMATGTFSWDAQAKAWVMALVKMGDYYYANVKAALAKNPAAGTVVELLSSSAADTDEVKCRTKGGTVTVKQGVDAYDVAELLGGAFKVSEDAQSLVYDYDLGVGGLTIRKATANEATEEIKEGDLVVEVTVKLAEGEVAPSRELADCTLTVTSILDKNETTKQNFTLKGLTFTDGECKVTIPYTEENFPMGTNRLTVSVSKGEATPPAEGGEETP